MSPSVLALIEALSQPGKPAFQAFFFADHRDDHKPITVPITEPTPVWLADEVAAPLLGVADAPEVRSEDALSHQRLLEQLDPLLLVWRRRYCSASPLFGRIGALLLRSQLGWPVVQVPEAG